MAKKEKKQRKGNRSIVNTMIVQMTKLIGSIFTVVFVVSVVMLWMQGTDSKETELTWESRSASYQLADFFDPHITTVQQLAVNHQIQSILRETKTGDNILETEGFEDVFNTMYSIWQIDPDNVLAVWIGDADANVITQSDGFTSGSDFQITQREWFTCTTTGKPILTEPYTDASTGNLILSAAAPVYDTDGKTVLGVAGVDISLEHVNTTLQNYKIGKTGYVALFSKNGTVVYHPDSEKILAGSADSGYSGCS